MSVPQLRKAAIFFYLPSVIIWNDFLIYRETSTYINMKEVYLHVNFIYPSAYLGPSYLIMGSLNLLNSLQKKYFVFYSSYSHEMVIRNLSLIGLQFQICAALDTDWLFWLLSYLTCFFWWNKSKFCLFRYILSNL